MTLNDAEFQGIRRLAAAGICSRPAITCFLMNCRMIQNQFRLSDEAYYDTVLKSADGFIELLREVDFELRRSGR